jgi:hypothetical protein
MTKLLIVMGNFDPARSCLRCQVEKSVCFHDLLVSPSEHLSKLFDFLQYVVRSLKSQSVLHHGSKWRESAVDAVSIPRAAGDRHGPRLSGQRGAKTSNGKQRDVAEGV